MTSEVFSSSINKDIVRFWVECGEGTFSLRDYPSKDPFVLWEVEQVLNSLVNDGELMHHHSGRRGWYRRANTQLIEGNIIDPPEKIFDVDLPFDMHNMVKIYNGNVIIVAGAPNAGKTAVMFDLIMRNQDHFAINYFNSEMSDQEAHARLKKIPVPITTWSFKWYKRSSDFEDVVDPSPNTINIIDFLEVHQDFYAIGGTIKRIHDQLGDSIAVICLQKNPDSETGLGGFRSMEVARLVLALDYGRVKITKAKNFRDPLRNPNGKIHKFKVVNGYDIQPDPSYGGWGANWMVEKKKDRKEIELVPETDTILSDQR